jgi:hypothetical protein
MSETAEVTRKRFSSRKHEQPVAGTTKKRTQAHVVTQASVPSLSHGRKSVAKKRA